MKKKKKKWLYWVYWASNTKKAIVSAIDDQDAIKEALRFCGTHTKISNIEKTDIEVID